MSFFLVFPFYFSFDLPFDLFILFSYYIFFLSFVSLVHRMCKSCLQIQHDDDMASRCPLLPRLSNNGVSLWRSFVTT